MKIAIDQLIGDEMLRQNRMLHEAPEGFGGSGWKHAEKIVEFAREIRAESLLDYGCGECTLRRHLKRLEFHIDIREYDPAIPRLAKLPKPADLVVCTDVLEHVEPDKLMRVMAHLYSLSITGCYLVIATRKANKILPNGRNAHLIVQDAAWWRHRVELLPWAITHEDDRRKGDGSGHEVRYWLKA